MEPFYDIDITEIDGFDNLHCPDGILRDVMERAGRLFGAETYLLVNGSTGGILSAVSAVVQRGERILMARNSHKAAFHAMYINGCKIVYIYPQILEKYGICGSVSPEEVKQKLAEYPDIGAVFLTTPTYDGVVSDVKAIVDAAHRQKIPVIVDAAHGAHFELDERFPENAVRSGADIVIHSIHKTLPALTQTALLHVQGTLVDRNRLWRFLTIYQTSSPSYILMAGIEQCISILETQKTMLCNRFFSWNRTFEKRMERLGHLRLFSTEAKSYAGNKLFDFDTGKKIVFTEGTALSGRQLYERLLVKYDLQMEMAGQNYVTAIMTIMDREEGFIRLGKALSEIDEELSENSVGPDTQPLNCEEHSVPAPVAVYDLHTAMEKKHETVLLEECEGRIAAEFIHIYPPGIPLIVPGEYFTYGMIRRLLSYREQGFTIEGMREHDQKVCVIGRE